MKRLIFLLSLLTSAVLFAEVTPISEIQGNVSYYSGRTVTVEGIITATVGKIGTGKAYLQDETGKGIMLYSSSLSTTAIVRGTRVRLNGTVNEYNSSGDYTTQLISISGVQVVSTGNPLPLTSLTYAQASNYNTWEGSMTSITGTMSEDPYSVGGGYNITLTNDSGETMAVRVWDTTSINVSAFKKNMPVKIQGIVSPYRAATQLLPTEQADIVYAGEAPYIINYTYTPSMPVFNRSFVVKAQIIDNQSVAQAVLRFRVNSQTVYYDSVMTALANNYFTATVPALSEFTADRDDDYVIRITAIDSVGNVTVSNDIHVGVSIGAPVISGFTYAPVASATYPDDYPNSEYFSRYPFLGDSVKVEARIKDSNGTVESALLKWRFGSASEYYALAMDSVSYSLATGTLYRGYIPAFDEPAEYVFYVEATDNDNAVSQTAFTSLKTVKKAPLVYDLYLLNHPNVGDSLRVTAKAVDVNGSITDVYLAYTTDFDNNPSQRQLGTLLVADTLNHEYTFMVKPKKKEGLVVNMSIVAVDNEGNATMVDYRNDGSAFTYTYPVTSHKALIKVDARAFDPSAGEKFLIRFNSKQGDKAILRIYSGEGKLVFTPVNTKFDYNMGAADPYSCSYQWDGRDKNGKKVPLGMYICQLEVTERSSGNKKTASVPIVVGDKLK